MKFLKSVQLGIVTILILQSTENSMRTCFAQCLDVIPHTKNCEFSRASGNGMAVIFFNLNGFIDCVTVVGELCPKEFIPAKKSKFVLCEYGLLERVIDKSRM